MELAFVIYLVDWLGDGGDPFIGFGGLASGALVVVVLFIILMAAQPTSTKVSEDAEVTIKVMNRFKTYFIVWFVLCFVGATLNAILPNKDTAYKMLAAYGVTEVAKSDQVRELGGKSLQVLEKAMDQYLKSGEEKKE